MEKRPRISHIGSVGIIYPRINPNRIFLERKTGDFPIKLFRHQLNFIGGNWIGESARTDSGPLNTFRRELQEELSLEKTAVSTAELAALGHAPQEIFSMTPALNRPVSHRHRVMLKEIKRIICANCVPFGTFLNTVSKAALDAADPDNKREGFIFLSAYWCMPLDKNRWATLHRLQTNYGNLSNESITLITSLDEMIESGTKTAFGNDRVLPEVFPSLRL
ncbi:MAG: hypothetical protein G01um101430_337 [Parcubacteria group bacterium Gr01-1014_30]|nr:MAG: hypothetical protein G01um101430_337 [Parcubacteria group bacterium Gr01-1014_30]